MLIPSDVCNEARALVGTDAFDYHVLPRMLVEGLNWACSTLNQALKICVYYGTPDTGNRNAIPLDANCAGVVGAYLVKDETMKPLLKTEFGNMIHRRPNWKTTLHTANMWCYTQPDTIVVDGSVAGYTLEIHYLQQPTPVEDIESGFVDPRFNAINPMAFSYLIASFCMQVAGDAASLQKARIYFDQGMALAGVQSRVQMPHAVSGGERAASGEADR